MQTKMHSFGNQKYYNKFDKDGGIKEEASLKGVSKNTLCEFRVSTVDLPVPVRQVAFQKDVLWLASHLANGDEFYTKLTF